MLDPNGGHEAGPSADAGAAGGGVAIGRAVRRGGRRPACKQPRGGGWSADESDSRDQLLVVAVGVWQRPVRSVAVACSPAAAFSSREAAVAADADAAAGSVGPV